MSTQSYRGKMPGIESGRRRITQDTRLTAKAVRGLYRRLRSWKAMARMLGKSEAFWWKVAHGEITGQSLSKQQRQRERRRLYQKIKKLFLKGKKK